MTACGDSRSPMPTGMSWRSFGCATSRGCRSVSQANYGLKLTSPAQLNAFVALARTSPGEAEAVVPSLRVELRDLPPTTLAVVRRQVTVSDLAHVVPECCGRVWKASRAQSAHAGRNAASSRPP